MNQSIEDILNSPDYFHCERYKVRMKKVECVRRQTAPKRYSGEIDHSWANCKSCEQGAFVKAEVGGRISEIRKRRRRPPRMDIIKKVEEQRAASVDDEPKDVSGVVSGRHRGLPLQVGTREKENMATKVCSKCNTPKDVKEFHVKKNTPDGLDYKCKQCKSDYAKERNARIKAGKNKPDGRRKKTKTNLEAVSAEILPSGDVSLSQDIAILETQNEQSMQEAAKFIIASVKKDLLGAVFQELRSR